MLAVGIALEEVRLGGELSHGVHLLILAVSAAAILGLGLQAPTEDGRPPAYQSVLLVTGLLLLYGALLRLSQTLGADYSASDLPTGALVWTGLLEAAAALWAAVAKRSAVSLLIAAIALGIVLMSALDWIFGAHGQGPYRVVLLLFSITLVLAALVLRGSRPRQAEQLINAAGLGILAIALAAVVGGLLQLIGLFGSLPDHILPNFWESVVLAAGCGLVAYGAVDRVPGAAYIGVANLVAFLVAVGVPPNDSLRWWPLLLIVVGLGAMAAGLRPLSPLPPEPDPYRAGEQPLAARADEEITLRVRDDSPPRRG